jgi:hypothetical protein
MFKTVAIFITMCLYIFAGVVLLASVPFVDNLVNLVIFSLCACGYAWVSSWWIKNGWFDKELF